MFRVDAIDLGNAYEYVRMSVIINNYYLLFKDFY